MHATRSRFFGYELARLALVVGCFCSLLGCTKSSYPNSEAAPYLLAETWKTVHTPLREELARLQTAGQLPASPIPAESAPRSNFIVELHSILENSPCSDVLRWSQARIDAGSLKITSREREWFHVLRERTQTERERLRTALSENLPLGYAPYAGTVHDFAFLADFRVSLALLHVELYESEVAQLPQAGSATLEAMLRLSQKLAEHGSVTTRMHAAQLRQTTFQILGQWLESESRHQDQLPELAATLKQLLCTWQQEAEIWQGERQLGLEFYERVRRGQLVSLLPAEWHAQLQKSNKLLVTLQQALRNIDQDELFYLQEIQRLEVLANRPYHLRAPDYASLKASMEQAITAPESPLLVANLLLDDFELTSLTMAQDRALCEAWYLAMQAAIANAVPENIPENPVTGEPYTLQNDGKRWLVRGVATPVGEAVVFVAHRNRVGN